MFRSGATWIVDRDEWIVTRRAIRLDAVPFNEEGEKKNEGSKRHWGRGGSAFFRVGRRCRKGARRCENNRERKRIRGQRQLVAAGEGDLGAVPERRQGVGRRNQHKV